MHLDIHIKTPSNVVAFLLNIILNPLALNFLSIGSSKQFEQWKTRKNQHQLSPLQKILHPRSTQSPKNPKQRNLKNNLHQARQIIKTKK